MHAIPDNIFHRLLDPLGQSNATPNWYSGRRHLLAGLDCPIAKKGNEGYPSIYKKFTMAQVP